MAKLSPRLISKKIFRAFLWLILALMAIAVIISFAIQIPAVQNYIVDKITQSLSKTLNTEVSVGYVDFDFFNSLEFRNILARDQHQDTLLFTGLLRGEIGLFSLLKKEIYLDNVTLENVYLNIHSGQKADSYNFQFLINNFAGDTSTTSVPADTSATSAWTIGLGKTSILQLRLNWQDTLAGFHLHTDLEEFSADLNGFDLTRQSIDVDELLLKNGAISFTQYTENFLPEDTIVKPLIFPFTGWDILADQIDLEQLAFRYDDRRMPRLADKLDYSHLDLTNLHLLINDFEWLENVMAAEIDKLRVKDHSGLEIEQFEVNLKLQPDLISLKDLVLQTSESYVESNTTLTFTSFDKLNDFLNQVDFEAAFTNTEIAMADLRYFIPDSLNIYRGNEPLSLDGKLTAKAGQMDLQHITLKLGNTLQLLANGQLTNVTTPELMTINLQIQELRANYAALRENVPSLALPPGGNSLGNIRIKGSAQGSLKQMELNQLVITTDASSRIAVKGTIGNLNKPDQLTYKLNITELYSNIEDVAGFIPDSTQAQLDLFEFVQYSGQLNGTLTDIYSKGELTTELGRLVTDAHIIFNSDYSNASYEGQIELDDFALGEFLQDTLGFGNASLTAKLNGKGLVLDSLDTEVEAVVGSIVFNDYTYQGIQIDGQIDKRKFLGTLSIDDPNLSFEFAGEADLNTERPAFHFEAVIDTIDLSALKLYPDTLRMSGRIVADFEGSELDNVLGDASLHEFWISNDTAAFYMDSLKLIADFAVADLKRLMIRSEIINGQIEGDFYIADLPKLIINFINDYFPVDQFISSEDQPERLAIEPQEKRVATDQSFIFQFTMKEPTKLTRFFTSQLTYLDTAVISGSLDTRERKLVMDAFTPRIIFAGVIADSFSLSVQNDNREIKALVRTPLVRSGTLEFRNNTIEAGFFNDSMSVALELHDRADSILLATAANISMQQDTYQLYFTDALILNGEAWEIDNRHQIGFTNDFLDIDNLRFTKGMQTVSLDSRDEPTDNDLLPIEITFANFEISEINDLVEMGGVEPSGLMNGSVVLENIRTNLHYLADINVDSLKLNGEDAGTLTLRAGQEGSAQKLEIFSSLKGAQNDLVVEGTYDIDAKSFNIEANIREIEMALLDPFLIGMIKDSKGQVSGNFSLSGTVEQPVVNGKLNFQNASTFVEYLQTAYTITEHSISINNERIDFGTLRLQDDTDNTATLSGYIAHSYFQTFRLNLDFNTDKFKMLNTSSKDNELFYGTMFIDARVEIRGTLENPRLNINARTLDNSQLYVMALSESQTIIKEDYIIYGTPEQLPLDSALNIDDRSAYTLGVSMSLNLVVTPGVELIIIVDPISGDQLSCKGNANISMQMDESGDINVIGMYTITSGSYNFSYEGLIKREFQILSGSRINFVGDPLDTRFDVTAAYRTRTSTYELIKNQTSLSQAEISRARNRSDVEVRLKIAGDLDKPELTFDIRMIQGTFGESNEAVERKLARLREDVNELNKQVFGLLLLNSFIAEESSNASLATAGENIALSSVSSLISNQLNRLAGNYVKGVNLSFDIESYRSQFSDETSASTVTNLNIGLSKSLLKNRLNIKVGTNLQVNNESTDDLNSSNYSSIAGDFILEYQLTKSGNYLLRVFRRSDYDALNESNLSKTGIGVSFNKSFGK